MPPSPRSLLVALVAVVLALSGCTSGGTTSAGEPTAPSAVPTPSTATSPVGSEPSPKDAPPASVPSPSVSGVRADVLTVEPPPGGSFLVRGTYPRVDSPCRRSSQPVLRARYPGELTVRRNDDGSLTVLVTLPFERYLEGIAEVPTSWPAAALEAQAIAARTYALATTGWTGDGTTLDEAICSTTSCQVYRGIPVPPSPGYGRWVGAVRRTAGRVLLHGGRPAQTLYFSTSNGRTYGNDEIFGSAPLPYLRPVTEHDDGASPTSHWRVSLRLADLGPILAAAELWPPDVPVRRVVPGGDAFGLSGPGVVRSIDRADFRTAVNQWAPCLLPGRYPGDSRFGSPLPLTIPSGWYAAAAGPSALVLTGRGWGHGVGMVQWGAYGKARRGLSAGDILAAYYGGLRPQAFPEPRVIDVEVASGLAGLKVVPSAAGARLDGDRLGRGPIVVTGGDRVSVGA